MVHKHTSNSKVTSFDMHKLYNRNFAGANVSDETSNGFSNIAYAVHDRLSFNIEVN